MANRCGRLSMYRSRRGQAGMKPANGFGLPGELVLAQKRPLVGKGDPEFSDIGQICPVHGIESKPQCPLAVRRFFPRVHAQHPF